MSLTERIDHLETLVFRMIEEKERVVQLSRWEVGNSFQDSEKEFDRTMEVIDETLTALRNLDLISSRFFAIERVGSSARLRRCAHGRCALDRTVELSAHRDILHADTGKTPSE